ncbi:MAG: prepilin-type N-terminal cleavage/methylation domain-containing protein [Polaromonas sp.]|uniref:PulJ/GspJ family protein n=1 Tax=Polaromonas sp. TaxID=1869339 RepID=UPI0027343DF0|nr:prepilin-type N-terminal cleavage/methylation domain-containing protein [Polaromonas sp.]MDP2818745.1 prepilin-type N-terminal cleavage/methylation domain-containing protein [Polaromonas sp.]
MTDMYMASTLAPSRPRGAGLTGGREVAIRLRPNRACGFTLIELMVAITVMALLAVLSWRGLDAMARAQAQTSLRADQVLTLQAGLAQWKIDLDALSHTPQVNPLDWDGRVLRLTRRTAAPGDGLLVVAWTRRTDDAGQWLRWQSPVVRTLSGWSDAWGHASAWAQGANTEDPTREVRITPLENWQIFYFRGNAWTHPMSSAGGQTAATPGQPAAQIVSQTVIPDGIRLVLMLPTTQAISGTLTVDWVNPTLSGEKS